VGSCVISFPEGDAVGTGRTVVATWVSSLTGMDVGVSIGKRVEDGKVPSAEGDGVRGAKGA
jgi:hypothetical protein